MKTTVEHLFNVGDIVNHATNRRINFKIIAIIFNGNDKETICYLCINVNSFGEKRNQVFQENELGIAYSTK